MSTINADVTTIVEAETVQGSFPDDDRPVQGMLKLARKTLAKRGLRVADAAEWVGIPTAEMHAKLNGDVDMRLDEYEALTRCINFKRWLDEDGRVQPKRTSITLTETQRGHVAAALGIALQQLEKATPSTDAERASYDETHAEVRETLRVVLAGGDR